MSTLKISGDLSLDAIAQRIRGIESNGFQFIGNTVNGNWNVVEYTYALMPDDIYLLPSSETSPADATIFWKGKMVSEKNELSVSAYRKVAATLAKADALSMVSVLTAASSGPLLGTICRATVVSRALSGVGSKTAYELENKRNPSLSAEQWPASGMRTDCSSFVAWCLRMSSKVAHPLYVKKNGGWFETSAVYEDGLQQTGYFSKVELAQPGSLLVYGDSKSGHGHIGIVTEAKGKGVKGASKVVHCSSGNFNKTGKAIQLTDAAAWLKRSDTIIVDFEGFS